MTLELLIAAFISGLYGSVHCLGMCGPVVGVLGLNTTRKQTISAFMTNIGRITTYVLLGLVAGAIGFLLNDIKPIQIILRYFAGFIMLFIALQYFGLPQFIGYVEKPFQFLIRPVQKISRSFFPIDTPLKAYKVGMIWGLLPCGMVYAAFAMSLGNSGFISSPLIMLAFGLGTAPAMISMSLTGNQIAKYLQQKNIRRFIGILLLAMTLFYMISMLMSDLNGGMHHHSTDDTQHGIHGGH